MSSTDLIPPTGEWQETFIGGPFDDIHHRRTVHGRSQ